MFGLVLYYYLSSLNNISSIFTALKHILCKSDVDYARKYCPAGGTVRQIVGIRRQLSGSEDCILGATYGSIKDKVWVGGGCMAEFFVLVEGRCFC